MKTHKNETQIIKLLCSSSSYLSSYQISEQTGINRRLIRNEMNNIKSLLKSLGYSLISKASKGYIIECPPPNTIQDLIKKIEQLEQKSYIAFPNLPNERHEFIIRRLLNTNDYIKIDDLADELLISRSSVSNDLKEVKQIIKKDHLSIVQRPGYGIKIIGNELDCRKPLVDILYTNFKNAALFYNLLRNSNQDGDLIETTIIDILERYHIEISDISLCDFLLTTSISITRNRLGFYLKEAQDIEDIKDKIEFKCAKDICRTLERLLNITLSIPEEIQMGIELLSKRSYKETANYHEKEANIIAKQSIEDIYNYSLIDFKNNKYLYNKLFIYTQSVLLRQRFGTKLRNPLYKEIEKKYTLSYELAEIISETFKRNHYLPLTQSELSHFSIIINTSLNEEIQDKKRALLICGISNDCRELIEWQIKERFGNELKIVKSTQFYKLRYEVLSHYDVIISTIPNYETFEIPYIYINSIMENEDFNVIKNYLAYSFYNHGVETLFHPKLFKSEVKAKNFQEVSKEMYQLIHNQLNLKNKSFDKILIDSKLTDYKHNQSIAIFKYNRAASLNEMVSVIITENQIMIKDKPAQIIILLSFKDRNEYFAKALTDILIHIAQNEKIVNQILTNPTYNNFLRIIKQYK